jgi:hypothetical protein
MNKLSLFRLLSGFDSGSMISLYIVPVKNGKDLRL